MSSRLLVASVAAALLAACGKGSSGPNRASVLVQMLAPADVTRIRLEAQPANVVRDVTGDAYDGPTGTFTSTLSVPVGSQTVAASAYVGTTLVGTASAPVEVTAGATATVHLTIVDSRPPVPDPDHAPIITAFVVPVTTLATGASAAVSVTATDLDGDAIVLAWSAMPVGCGTFADATAGATTFTAGAVGACRIAVSATANGKADTAAFDLAVTDGTGTGSVSVGGTVITRPEVYSMTFTPEGSSSWVLYRTSADGVSPTPAVAGTRHTVAVHWRSIPQPVAATLVDSCGGSTALQGEARVGEYTVRTFTWFPTTPAATRSACAVTVTLSVTGLPPGASLVDTMSAGFEVVPPAPPPVGDAIVYWQFIRYAPAQVDGFVVYDASLAGTRTGTCPESGVEVVRVNSPAGQVDVSCQEWNPADGISVQGIVIPDLPAGYQSVRVRGYRGASVVYDTQMAVNVVAGAQVEAVVSAQGVYQPAELYAYLLYGVPGTEYATCGDAANPNITFAIRDSFGTLIDEGQVGCAGTLPVLVYTDLLDLDGYTVRMQGIATSGPETGTVVFDSCGVAFDHFGPHEGAGGIAVDLFTLPVPSCT